MRLTTVFALFLLARIPPCSSDGSPSVSRLPTTDSPAADIMHLLTTENNTSITNHANDSTALANRARNGEAKAPSTGDDSQLAPSPHPPIESQADIKPQALAGETTRTTNLTDIEDRSSSEINSLLEQAKTRKTNLTEKRDGEKVAWDKKNEEADQSKNDYDNKHEIWKGLEKIAVETAETWDKDETNNITATREYKEAEDLLKQINEDIIREKAKVEEFPALIQKATTEREEVEKTERERNARLQELNNNKTKKIDGKPALEASIPILEQAEIDARKDWNSAKRKAETSQTNFDNDGCNKPEKLNECKDKKESLDLLKADAQSKKEIHEKALEKRTNAKNELANFDKDMRKINDEIDTLETAKLDYDHDLAVAQRKENNLKSGETRQKERVDGLVKSKPAAMEDEGKKKIARDEANEKVKNGRPPEVDNTRNKADSAFSEAHTANRTMIRIHRELAECKTNLDETERSLTQTESEVAKLTDLLKKAEAKEAAQKGSIVPYVIGGMVFIAIVAVVVVVVVVYFQKKKKNTGKKAEKTVKGTSTVVRGSQTPSTTEVAVPTRGPLTPLTTAVQAPTPNPPSPNPVTQPDNLGPRQYRDIHGLVVEHMGPEGFECKKLEGEYKKKDGEPDRIDIPAEYMNYEGPLRRRTRWHGEPKHDFDGQKGVDHVDKIWFDPKANSATEIGKNEIMEASRESDGGPPSDSNRSEWLNSLEEYEKGRAAQEAKEKKSQTSAANGKETSKEKASKSSKSHRKKESKKTPSKASKSSRSHRKKESKKKSSKKGSGKEKK